jgi:terminase small subunit-like protein
MLKLSARQQRFVKHYVRLGNASLAAREAGYAEVGARVTACRLLANPNIQAAVSAERRRYEQDLRITREQVITELRSAIDIARTQGNASAMISGWREIAKICGYYDRRVEVSIHPNVAAQRLIGQLETMSSDELMKIAESSTN